MFRNRVYYRLKPLLPPALRLSVRRWFALRKRQSVEGVWPILPGSERAPEGWPGWPEGKKFAVVLTHDVEGQRGLDRCLQLMQLEKKAGFRSSFNLIPEGDYQSSSHLRAELRQNGFEVGVHDLRHDGKLYQSRQIFSHNAERINRYLKEWNATGFRSGFMHHNLDWLHDLNIQYDASTFDTDPFEPQPDGVGTIFPFWVPRPSRASRPASNPASDLSPGYVELPYTLPQDSTMFVLFRESSLSVWKEKLDWVAHHGGMVLLDSHPDYINFQGKPFSGEYRHTHYEGLLRYLQQKYAGQFWHALPREVAEYTAPLRLRPPARGKKICMVSYSAYESDNRVMRYAEALAARGDSVDIVAIKKDDRVPDTERIKGVRVHRLQSRSNKNQQRRGAYLFPILRFWLLSSWWLARKQFSGRYDFIHVHNVPDFLVFTTWAPKLLGTKVLLDIHDIVPEFYASKFKSESDRFDVKLLKQVERASARFADHVIISNHLWYEKYVSRSAPARKCSVFVNHVDSAVFFRHERTRADDKFILLFPGGLQWHQGLDIAIRAFARIAPQVPTAEFHIYGDGNMRGQLLELTSELKMQERVKFFSPLPVREIVKVMANADLGVVPKRADSFGNEAYSTKIMEFMAVGVPVVISKTRIDQYYFTEDVVRFFESGNVEALADAMLDLIRDQSKRKQLVLNAAGYVKRNSWETKRHEYLNLVDTLTARNGNGNGTH